MLTTALDLVRGAMRLCGALGESQSVSGEDAQICLEALNEMKESWNLDRDLVYVAREDLLTWPSGAVSQTIGPGGDFNIPRPVKLVPGTFMRDSQGRDYTLRVIEEREEYNYLITKSETRSSYPWLLFYEMSYPLGRLYLYPVPDTQITIGLTSRKELQQFESLTDLLNLPPGYRRAIRYNLAVAIEPEFVPGALPQAVAAIAVQSLALVKRLNLPRGKADISHVAMMYGRNRGRYDARTMSPYGR